MDQTTHVAAGRRWWLYGFAGVILLLLVAPSMIVVPMSFTSSTFLEFPPREWSLRWYRAYIETPAWREATVMSLKVASLTVIIATPLGAAAAYAVHVAEWRFKRVASALLVAPLLVPHILIAIGIFFTFVKLGLTNTVIGVTLAHAMVALPFVFILTLAGLKRFDMTLEFAARSLGASRPRAFFYVTLPYLKNSLIFAALISFISSFDEVIISMFLATGQYSMLTRRMFLSLRDAIDPTIASISSILIVISVIVVVASQLQASTRGDRREDIGKSPTT
jgi:putative spermidine/putrescine transport system permease protein